jgi:hypothetical protein
MRDSPKSQETSEEDPNPEEAGRCSTHPCRLLEHTLLITVLSNHTSLMKPMILTVLQNPL